ncbi:hypothetical protein bsdtw1_00797 [Clostridium fungisolvens]|uniref:DUF3784 domain-containing protein n=1 Tax=Clostridium fungisolvens TaxID=1604897 RepID=A0A6V8SDW5_9CLOT|nr:hypothetical protein bsdtw1_00797 [Clostridium fungisolvens]
MNIIIKFISYSLIVLGSAYLIFTFIGAKKWLYPNPKKFNILNERAYLNSIKILFSTIGFCYIILGLSISTGVLSFNIGPSFAALFPALMIIVNNIINKKYLIRKADL